MMVQYFEVEYTIIYEGSNCVLVKSHLIFLLELHSSLNISSFTTVLSARVTALVFPTSSEPKTTQPFQQLMVACQPHWPDTTASCLDSGSVFDTLKMSSTLSKQSFGMSLGTISRAVAVSNCIFLLHRPCYEWTRQRRRERTLVSHGSSINTDMRTEVASAPCSKSRDFSLLS